LNDTVAIITGAGSGIGRAVARGFIEEGARVVGLDVSAQRLAALQQEFPDRLAISCGDVRSFADNAKAVRLALDRFGALNVFVGNAGVWDGRRRLTDLSERELSEGFDELFAVNVKGYLLGAKAASAELARSRGRMIFTLSTSSYHVGGGGPIYVAAKHAGLGIVRALAHELAPHIRVNGVAPAGTVTAMADAPSLAANPPATAEIPAGGRNNILHINIAPEDHVGSYVLLASGQSRAMTGTVINSDGGRAVMNARTD
jgi:NAD(P)-dependent dehydrogenase (short-subunit alcohol dehydrogenase family)